MAGEPSPEDPLRGSCLCGGVRFEVTAPFLWANHCHCSRCRKHSGAFGGTPGRVPREGFRLLAGEELIRVFRPEGGRVEAFCSVCGASLFGGDWPEGDEVAIRLGSLDGDPGIRPQFHVFVASRAPGTSSRTMAYLATTRPIREPELPRFASSGGDAGARRAHAGGRLSLAERKAGQERHTLTERLGEPLGHRRAVFEAVARAAAD
jgi:hypothetical protein